MSKHNDNPLEDTDVNGWSKYQIFVLRELKRLNKGYDDLDKKVDGTAVELHHKLNKIITAQAFARGKSIGFGALGASIPVIAGLILAYLALS